MHQFQLLYCSHITSQLKCNIWLEENVSLVMGKTHKLSRVNISHLTVLFSLTRETTITNLWLAHDQVVHLETIWQICMCHANNYFAIFFYFDFRGVIKKLMSVAPQKQWVLFAVHPQCPSWLCLREHWLGKQNCIIAFLCAHRYLHLQ